MSDLIAGIDLGTTNSEVAAFSGGRVRILGPGNGILPSCVGVSPSGEFLVGEAALNQQRLFPDRTIRGIKRKMGTSDMVSMAGHEYSPQEISALILKELVNWAGTSLGQPVKRAVITVPAYFSDAQRNATREAGNMAGLEVVRILNEPTAASLAYGFAGGGRHTVMVYDLGGGTFDVSIVTIEGEVTEVLSSHGNNRLGGDDFDDLLVMHLQQEFHRQHGVFVGEEHRAARARLWWAAEQAKKQLSSEPYTRIREEALIVDNGRPLHLDVEVSRDTYESLIRPLVDSTLDSVSKALDDAGRSSSSMDAILLIGGSTRTPLVSRLLRERTGLEPRQDVHPDLGVALGAGVLASRLAGQQVDRVLVDVSPFSFGPSYLGDRGGIPYPYCYHPVIRRNTPLPVTRTESYYTSYSGQTTVEIQVFQGDNEDALNNILVGNFRIEGLKDSQDPNEVLCRMSLDVDGILHVSAIEKATGKSKQITIGGALQPKTEREVEESRRKVEELFGRRDGLGGISEEETDDLPAEYELLGPAAEDLAVEPEPAPRADEAPPADPAWSERRHKAVELIKRARAAAGKMHGEDREEARALQSAIEAAVQGHDSRALDESMRSLEELLFFVEGS